VIPWNRKPDSIQKIDCCFTEITIKSRNEGMDKTLYCINELAEDIVDKLNEEFGFFNS